MIEPGFFEQYALPVFEHLSKPSKQAILRYLAEGNRTFREKKLLEFFKGLDWLPPEELGNTPLEHFSAAERSRILKEIQAYFEHKAAIKLENSNRRKIYQQKVYTHFRSKVPTMDKLQLEELRDYELELTGRDANWQHYFSFKSIKKIDAFLQLTPMERQALFFAFKQDVQTYKKNYEKLRDYAQWVEAGSPIQFNFDDWCDWSGEEFSTNRQNRAGSASNQSNQSNRRNASPDLRKAYQTLNLSPEATFLQIRKQFRQLTLQYHPDIATGNPEQMKQILSAYETLKKHFS